MGVEIVFCPNCGQDIQVNVKPGYKLISVSEHQDDVHKDDIEYISCVDAFCGTRFYVKTQRFQGDQ